jgi:lipopolysaccharide/colanic/teichoic acid biosynthesis glycosyltransferase
MAAHAQPAGDRAKRALDVVLVLIGMVLLAPLFAVLAWKVRRELGRPVIFLQDRPGLHGRLFQIRKFRTMTNVLGPDGRLLPDEDRLRDFGRRLRSTSMDEIPEMVNVLKGEMSLVGPRPLLVEYLPHYTPEQARRHEVRPGITGWAQVNGRNNMPWDEKLALDVWYVDNRSLWLDVRILLRTLWVMVTRQGVTLEGHATTVRFYDDARRRRTTGAEGAERHALDDRSPPNTDRRMNPMDSVSPADRPAAAAQVEHASSDGRSRRRDRAPGPRP